MINIIPHDHEIHDELLLLPVDELRLNADLIGVLDVGRIIFQLHVIIHAHGAEVLRLNFGTAFSKIVFTFRTAPSKKLVDENQGYNQTNRI